jgi:hypothetical protein
MATFTKKQVAKLFNPHVGVSLVLRAAPLCCHDLLQTGRIVCNELLAALLGNFDPFLMGDGLQLSNDLGLPSATAFFKSHHRFSIGFKSGDCDGHSRTFHPFSLIKPVWILMYAWGHYLARKDQ